MGLLEKLKNWCQEIRRLDVELSFLLTERYRFSYHCIERMDGRARRATYKARKFIMAVVWYHEYRPDLSPLPIPLTPSPNERLKRWTSTYDNKLGLSVTRIYNDDFIILVLDRAMCVVQRISSSGQSRPAPPTFRTTTNHISRSSFRHRLSQYPTPLKH